MVSDVNKKVGRPRPSGALRPSKQGQERGSFSAVRQDPKQVRPLSPDASGAGEGGGGRRVRVRVSLQPQEGRKWRVPPLLYMEIPFRMGRQADWTKQQRDVAVGEGVADCRRFA